MPPLWSRSFCQAVERMALSQTVQNSTWMFPAIETTHLIAMIVLVGSITAFDLRLLGLAMQGTSVSRLAWRLLPATWTAFAVMAITGSLLFTSDPVEKYCHNPALQVKLLLILLSGVNMAQAAPDPSLGREHGCVPLHDLSSGEGVGYGPHHALRGQAGRILFGASVGRRGRRGSVDRVHLTARFPSASAFW